MDLEGEGGVEGGGGVGVGVEETDRRGIDGSSSRGLEMVFWDMDAARLGWDCSAA